MSDSKSSTGTSAGIGMGAVIAMLMSWAKVHSILWCMLHGALGWLYVIYYVIRQDY